MRTPLQFIRSLKLSDRITIIISLVALGASGFSLYKQYHETIDLRIYGSNFGARPVGDFTYYPYVDLAIVDTGNTPTIVTSVSNYFVETGQTCNSKPEKNWIGILSNDRYYPSISYPVKPGEANTSRIYFDAYKVEFAEGVWVIAKTPCVEIGTIDIDYKESWKTLTLGTIWFGASNPNERPPTVNNIAFATTP